MRCGNGPDERRDEPTIDGVCPPASFLADSDHIEILKASSACKVRVVPDSEAIAVA